MFRFTHFATSLFCSICLIIGCCQAGIIYDTFGSGFTGTVGSFSTLDARYNQLFEVDTVNIGNTGAYLGMIVRTSNVQSRLERVLVPFQMESAAQNISPVRLSLYSSIPNQVFGIDFPKTGSLVADLTTRNVISGGAPSQMSIFEYSPPVHVILSANTNYWVVADYHPTVVNPANRNTWYGSSVSRESFEGLDFDFGLGFEPPFNGFWNVEIYGPTGPGLAIRLEGTAVPETAAIVDFTLVIIGLVITRIGWRRYKCRSKLYRLPSPRFT